MTGPRPLRPETLGAWLLKGSGGAGSVEEAVASGFVDVGGWCVRPSYRTALVEAGQPVLFWVSGSHPERPAGIWAQGRALGPVPLGEPRPSLPVALTPLAEPVPRADLLAHPVLAGLEVLRMPAGSNPSYLSPAELAALREDWPQVTVDR